MTFWSNLTVHAKAQLWKYESQMMWLLFANFIKLIYQSKILYMYIFFSKANTYIFFVVEKTKRCSFSIAITSLGEERANLSAFRMFVWFVLVWFCRFLLPLGVWEGLRFVIVAFPGLSYLCFCFSTRKCSIKTRKWVMPLANSFSRMFFDTIWGEKIFIWVSLCKHKCITLVIYRTADPGTGLKHTDAWDTARRFII